MTTAAIVLLVLTIILSIASIALAIRNYRRNKALLAEVVASGEEAKANSQALLNEINAFNADLRSYLERPAPTPTVDQSAVIDLVAAVGVETNGLGVEVKTLTTKVEEIQEGLIAILEAMSGPPPGQDAPAGKVPAGQCQEKGCTDPGTVTATIKVKGQQKLKDVLLCEGHGKALVKQAFSIPGAAGSFEGVGKDGQPFKESFDNNICEHGFNHVNDPDWVPGQIHAHVDVETREEFLAKEGIAADAEPDDSVLHPEPLDPITAMIEEQFRQSKAASKGA